jgi:hypothetical protein
VAAQGVMHIGPMRVPLRFERRYDDYTVRGTAVDLATLPERPDGSAHRPCRPRTSFQVQANVGAAVDSTHSRYAGATDTLQAVRSRTLEERRAAQRGEALPADSADGCDRVFIVHRPPARELLQSELLPGDIYASDSPVLRVTELEDLADRVRRIPDVPWHIERPRLAYGLRDGLTRYNRVEGLSVGVRADLDLGRTALDGEVRAGTVGEVGAELGVTRRGSTADGRLGVYRRLDVADVSVQPFGPGSSLTALLLGRDDQDYFRAVGAEVNLTAPLLRPQWWALRLFAERQQSVGAGTDFHLRRLLDGDRSFRPNLVADPASQAGATLLLRAAGQGSITAPRWGTELALHGETGDFTFARPSLRLRAALPLTERFGAGVELAGGSTFGSAPAQRQWQLGGAPTLRGYAFGAAAGETFWTARAELATGRPFARFVVFGDAGWAGPRDRLTAARPLHSAGIGLSLLDGILRMDLARAAATGEWRVHLRLDGVL